jgi:hypothetical protein
MDHAGKAEYMARFPAYAHEYIRRKKFEEALVKVQTECIERAMNKVKRGVSPTTAIQKSPVGHRHSVENAKSAEHDIATVGSTEEGAELMAANLLLRCCPRRAKKSLGLSAAIDITAYDVTHWEACMCPVLPTQSWIGLFMATGSFAYIGWCLNYLLLFTARMSENTMNSVATSFGISQATSIFITQPLTLGATLCFLWLLEKYRHRRGTSVPKHNIGYFADPRYSSSSTSLSGSWAYWIFFYAASHASIRPFKADVTIGYSSTRVAAAWMLDDSELQTVVSSRDSAITALYVYLRGLEKPVNERNAHKKAAVREMLSKAREDAHVSVVAEDEDVALSVFQKIAADK